MFISFMLLYLLFMYVYFNLCEFFLFRRNSCSALLIFIQSLDFFLETMLRNERVGFASA